MATGDIVSILLTFSTSNLELRFPVHSIFALVHLFQGMRGLGEVNAPLTPPLKNLMLFGVRVHCAIPVVLECRTSVYMGPEMVSTCQVLKKERVWPESRSEVISSGLATLQLQPVIARDEIACRALFEVV